MTAALPLDRQLCFSLYAASMAVQRLFKPQLDGFGITYAQYLVLHALWERDGRSIGEVASRLGLESSTVTPLVKRLEAGGFVTRERNPTDERQVMVRLTPRGAGLRAECGCLAEALVARSAMDLEQLEALNRSVQTFRDALLEGQK